MSQPSLNWSSSLGSLFGLIWPAFLLTNLATANSLPMLPGFSGKLAVVHLHKAYIGQRDPSLVEVKLN